MTEVNRRYFEGLMRDRDLSLRALAKRMGLGHSQLSLTFSGDRKLQVNEAVQLSSIFGVPLAEIIEASGVSMSQAAEVRVPVVGAVQGDGTVAMTDADRPERTSAPDVLPPDAIAVQCRTAGSNLDWVDGWVMFARRTDQVDPGILGRFAIAKIGGGPVVVSSVRRGYRENTYNLRGLYEADSVKLDWGSPVILTRN